MPRAAGTREGLTLIFLSMLPIMAIAGLVADLPVLLRVFGHEPHHEIVVPMVLTIPSLCVALFAPVAGVIADRWGRRPLLLLALLAFSLLGLAPLLFTSFPAILASRVVVGLAEASILTCTNALWGDYFPDDARRRWLGLQQMSGPVFNALLALAGGALATLHWSRPFWLYALGLVAFGFAAMVLWEPARAEGAPARAEGAPAANAGSPFPWATAGRIAAVTFGVSIVFFTLAIQQGRIFAALGVVSPAVNGQLIMAVSLAAIVGAVVFNRLRQRPTAQLLALGLLSYGVGYIGIAQSTNVVPGALASALAQFGSSIVLPALIAWTLASFLPEHRGRGIGLWGAVFFAGQFFSAPLLTGLEHLQGDLLGALALVGGATLLAAGAAIWFNRQPVVSGK